MHVYIDVSGSMQDLKDALYGAVLDCRDYVCPQVHLFSTQVADISLHDLDRGICRSTGGTDIACVAEHMATHRVRRALLLTDGWVGSPSGQHRSVLGDARLAVAFAGDNVNVDDLRAVIDFSETLPAGG